MREVSRAYRAVVVENALMRGVEIPSVDAEDPDEPLGRNCLWCEIQIEWGSLCLRCDRQEGMPFRLYHEKAPAKAQEDLRAFESWLMSCGYTRTTAGAYRKCIRNHIVGRWRWPTHVRTEGSVVALWREWRTIGVAMYPFGACPASCLPGAGDE